MHIGNLAVTECVQHPVRYIRGGEFVSTTGEHAGNVKRNVSRADDRDTLGVQVKVSIGGIRMSVIPIDKILCTETTREIFARHAEPALGLSAGGIYNRVIMSEQIRTSYVGTKANIANESNLPFIAEYPAEHPFHRFHLLIIGRYAIAYQPVRSWKSIKNIHRNPGR